MICYENDTRTCKRQRLIGLTVCIHYSVTKVSIVNLYCNYTCSASAACKSMGYESGEYISRDGEMTGYDIALGGVSCPAAAWGIQECTSNGWGNYECTHADDLGVRCCK